MTQFFGPQKNLIGVFFWIQKFGLFSTFLNVFSCPNKAFLGGPPLKGAAPPIRGGQGGATCRERPPPHRSPSATPEEPNLT